MTSDPTSDLLVTFGMVPQHNRLLRFLQAIKLVPVLVGLHYRIRVGLENCRYETLRDVNVSLSVWVGLGGLGERTVLTETIQGGDISARDKKTVFSKMAPLMRQPGAADIAINSVTAGGQPLTMSYQNETSTSVLFVYLVHPWADIIPRVTAIIVLLTFLMTALKWIFYGR